MLICINDFLYFKKMPWIRRCFFKVSVFLCLIILSNCIQHTQPNEDNLEKTMIKTNQTEGALQPTPPPNSIHLDCPANQECKNLIAPCLKCEFNLSCVYGAKVNVTCTPADNVKCSGEKQFLREMTCRYCYQTDHWEHTCVQKANCNTVAAPKVYYRTNCSVKDDVICLGRRTFKKNLPCNWTGGYRWSTAVILSITLGGFGADRFYLGHWQEGIGKLFSFGGLGVWTLIDVILISLRYLGPADGSLYI